MTPASNRPLNHVQELTGATGIDCLLASLLCSAKRPGETLQPESFCAGSRSVGEMRPLDLDAQRNKNDAG